MRAGSPRTGRLLLAVVAGWLPIAATAGWSAPAGGVAAPSTPVGRQLSWFLGATTTLPVSPTDLAAHADPQFLAQVSAAELTAVLETTPGPMRLVKLTVSQPTSLQALVSVDGIELTVAMSVDTAGLIDGLRLIPVVAPSLRSWSAIDRATSSVAPGVGLLAARVTAGGVCQPVRAISANRPRPLGSMFKLFVLGALANAVRHHRVTWNQPVIVTAASKVGGSGTLATEPDGTALTVEQVAAKMISVSDNTAADLLLSLLGRSAVEAQVRQWSAHPSLDVPFLSVSELFALKYHDFPVLADHYLSLGPAGRAAYLTATVDQVTAAEETASSDPRDINSIEWFASPADMCRSLAGLAGLDRLPGLATVGSVLSINDGGLGLPAAIWPRVWFKGGSEDGVLTLGYLARDAQGHTDVVVVMAENPTSAFDEEVSSVKLLDVVASAFGLLHRAR